MIGHILLILLRYFRIKNLAIIDLEFPGFTNFFNKLFQLITFVKSYLTE